MAAYIPPGWPTGVHPPGSEDFEATAIAWLLDVVPPDFRLHGVLRRHPVALAVMARHHGRTPRLASGSPTGGGGARRGAVGDGHRITDVGGAVFELHTARCRRGDRGGQGLGGGGVSWRGRCHSQCVDVVTLGAGVIAIPNGSGPTGMGVPGVLVATVDRRHRAAGLVGDVGGGAVGGDRDPFRGSRRRGWACRGCWWPP